MTERDHEVRDGERRLTFTGTLLGESDSKRREPRWVEFKLYRTKAGSYVLSRVGRSLVYHSKSCALTSRYRLKPGSLEADAVPCEECGGYASPTEDVYPEKIRYWAQVMEAPSAVVEALMKYDDEGTRYLTQVAQRLLQLASIGDEGIRDAYMVEHVA